MLYHSATLQRMAALVEVSLAQKVEAEADKRKNICITLVIVTPQWLLSVSMKDLADALS